MGRSSETYNKKEVRNKKEKKRKDKAQKRQERKEQGKTSMDDMIAYVDANGNLTDTPPDLTQKEEIDAESIELGIPKKEDREESTRVRKGTVTRFDDSKGYGFIQDSQTKDSIFVHINDCEGDIKGGSSVTFETERGVKGIKAVNVVVK